MEKACAVLLNVAVTLAAAESVKTHVVTVPAQTPPVQPANVLPFAGVAVSVMLVPAWKAVLHTVPQLMPAGLEVTVPAPVPFRDTSTCGRITCSEIGMPELVLSAPLTTT